MQDISFQEQVSQWKGTLIELDYLVHKLSNMETEDWRLDDLMRLHKLVDMVVLNRMIVATGRIERRK